VNISTDADDEVVSVTEMPEKENSTVTVAVDDYTVGLHEQNEIKKLLDIQGIFPKQYIRTITLLYSNRLSIQTICP